MIHTIPIADDIPCTVPHLFGGCQHQPQSVHGPHQLCQRKQQLGGQSAQTEEKVEEEEVEEKMWEEEKGWVEDWREKPL